MNRTKPIIARRALSVPQEALVVYEEKASFRYRAGLHLRRLLLGTWLGEPYDKWLSRIIYQLDQPASQRRVRAHHVPTLRQNAEVSLSCVDKSGELCHEIPHLAGGT